MSFKTAALTVVIASVAAAATALIVTPAQQSAAQTGAPLVYICSGTQGPSNPSCTNDQEFEAFDHNGAPIFSIGEFGGAAVFGDNSSVFPPGSVTNPSVVESYTTPAGYGSTTCKVPAIWIAPQGLWKCSSGGTWTKQAPW